MRILQHRSYPSTLLVGVKGDQAGDQAVWTLYTESVHGLTNPRPFRGLMTGWEPVPDPTLPHYQALGEKASRRGEHLRGRTSAVPGAGRKGPGGLPVPAGARGREILLTEEEYAAVRELVAKMRAAG